MAHTCTGATAALLVSLTHRRCWCPDTDRELRQLEARLKSSTEAAGKYDVKYLKTQEHLEVWRDNIHALFAKTGCNRAAVAEVLGNQGVTDTNVMQYMGEFRCL